MLLLSPPGVLSWVELILHCLRSTVTYPKASNASLFLHSLTGLLLSDMSAVVFIFNETWGEIKTLVARMLFSVSSKNKPNFKKDYL